MNKNFFKVEDLGVLNGKTGIIIFLYHYSKYSNCNICQKLGRAFLGKVFNDISENTPVNFTSGLVGIEWAIE